MALKRGLVDATDADLLRSSVGQPEAFGVFYDRYERQVLAFFLHATGRPELAADLAGEVFAQALRSVGSYSAERGSARGWLFGIARHTLADAWERGRVEDRARRALSMEPLVLSDSDLERIEALDGTALELLEGLPSEQRWAIQGRVLEGRPYAELAAELECSQSVVRQRVSRGLRNLRSRLERMP